jgi:hypothetical protein
MVKIKNIGKQDLAFTGFPVIKPGETIDVSVQEAEILKLNDDVQVIE